jgi:hypothetical protein
VGLIPIVQLATSGVPRTGEDWAGFVCPVAVTSVTTLPFFLWGVGMLVAGLRERATFARGVRAKARIVSSKPTGTEINDQPEMELTLDVLFDPPVRSKLRTVVHVGQLHALRPGAVLFVRVDPKRPAQAVLDE